MQSSRKEEGDAGTDGADGESLTSVIVGPSFASEFLLAEYKTLRDEVLKKMDHRTSMVVCSVTVSSAVLALGIERRSGSLLLVSPLVSLLLGILILFHNVQIGETSTYLRDNFERPLFRHYGDFVGWHRSKSNPRYRLRERMATYHLPLFLIAVAPAVVAIPLALSNFGPLALTLPVLVVDALLLLTYVVQIVKHRESI